MLTNNLKIFGRSLVRHRLHAAINILGLAVGIAACLLISLFVLHETSYDEYHAKADRLYRISRNFETGRYAYNAAPTGPLMQELFPAIEASARLTTRALPLVRDDGLIYEEAGIRFADASLFDLFDLQWLAGDPAGALAEPASIVLTEALARKYFPEGDAMGGTLEVGDRPLRVTGILADLPDDTHLDFHALVPWQAQGLYASPFAEVAAYEEWSHTTVHTYVLLREGADIVDVAAALPDFVARHVPPWRGDPTSMEAIKVTDIHLHGALREFKPLRDPVLLMILAGIAAAVLAIACINFMILATARGSLRAREIGVRKSIGASRVQLIRQFLGESLLTTALALIVAIALVEALLPAFNAFVGLDIAFPYSGSPVLLLALVGGGVFTGVMAGAWPAFFLASFRTVNVIKGDYSSGRGGLKTRSILVILQFTAAIALIVCTVVMVMQMRLSRGSYEHLDLDEVVEIALPSGENARLFERELLAHPAIAEVSVTDRGPFFEYRTVQFMSNANDPAHRAQVYPWSIDHDFLDFFDIDVLAGRGFIADSLSDRYDPPRDEDIAPGDGLPAGHASFLLNESAARAMGWEPEDAVGQVLRWEHRRSAGSVPETLPVEGPVVGVVEDFIYETVTAPVKPMIIRYDDEVERVMVRIGAGQLPTALAHIEATWRSLWPDQPARPRVLEEDFRTHHRGHFQQTELISYFSTIAVLLACFGLVGLAAFNAERRTKEIGVRKVMGSGVWRIVLLLTKDFSKLVLIANVIAWPLAYVAMERWLQNFAYRVDLGPLIFIGSGLIALCVAWVTVGGTAAKAASARPVLALRYE